MMDTCENCQREYNNEHGLTCKYCGYNNGPGDNPRSLQSIIDAAAEQKHGRFEDGQNDI